MNWELMNCTSRELAIKLTEQKIQVDCIVTDPPYSEKTHQGNAAAKYEEDTRRKIDYPHFTPLDVKMFVELWNPICRGWFCVLTDHKLVPYWEDEFSKANRYVFANIPVIISGMTVRASGDGHSTESVWLVAARPRTKEFSTWGTLKGWYKSSGRDSFTRQVGGKPVDVIGDIIRDHSRQNDLVCDPFAGGGTTIVAAIDNGRRAVGCEINSEMAQIANQAIAKRANQTSMFSVIPTETKKPAIQKSLLETEK